MHLVSFFYTAARRISKCAIDPGYALDSTTNSNKHIAIKCDIDGLADGLCLECDVDTPTVCDTCKDTLASGTDCSTTTSTAAQLESLEAENWFSDAGTPTACDTNCKTCFGASDTCTSCPIGYTFYENTVAMTSVCYVSSTASVFDSNHAIERPCVEGCQFCSGVPADALFYECDTCFPHYRLNTDTRKCETRDKDADNVSYENKSPSCTETQYLTANGKDCLPCDSNCKSCIGTADNCTSCKDPLDTTLRSEVLQF
jgi:hypothetical protein